MNILRSAYSLLMANGIMYRRGKREEKKSRTEISSHDQRLHGTLNRHIAQEGFPDITNRVLTAPPTEA